MFNPFCTKFCVVTKQIQNVPKQYETHQYYSLGSNGADRVVCCKKFQCDFMAQTCALIAQFQPILHGVPCSIKTLPNAPKHYEMHTYMSFVARTFPLIAPVQPVSHQASCSNKTIQNAPKHYETQQYVSLGSNGVGRVHSWRKIPKRLHGTNLCINCTSSTHFVPSFV